MQETVQRAQPEGVPPLELTGERTLPDVPAENYWFRRHLAVYEWVAERCRGRDVVDMACGEGYGVEVLARRARSVTGVDANPEAHEHARLKYTRPGVRLRARPRGELRRAAATPSCSSRRSSTWPTPRAILRHFRGLLRPGGAVYVSTPNLLTLAPPGAEKSDNPWHLKRVPGGGVPAALRERLRPGRAARPLPRARAARARAGAACRLGPGARGARDHEAVLRPLHAGHLGARLRAPARPARPRARLRRGASPLTPAAAGRARARPPLAHALRGGLRHLAVRRGVAVGGRRVRVPAAARAARRRAGDGRADARCCATSSTRCAATRASASCASCARCARRSTRRTRAGSTTRASPRWPAEVRRAAADYTGAERAFEERGRDLVGGVRGARRGGAVDVRGHPRPAPAAWPPTRASASRSATGTAAHRQRFGDWGGGFWLPECAYVPGLERELAEHGVRSFCVDQTEVAGFDHLTPVAHRAGPGGGPDRLGRPSSSCGTTRTATRRTAAIATTGAARSTT